MHFFPIKIFKYLKEQYRHGFWRAKMYQDHPKMSKGDDYTFWKDIIEPPLVIAVLLSGILALAMGGMVMEAQFTALTIYG